MDARVQDYLDDRLQSLADFDTLDTLLETVQTSQSLLKRQLDDAKRDHSRSCETSTTQSGALREKIQHFQDDQKEIDQRLLHITNSDTSDEAVARFTNSMTKLQCVDIMSGYLETLLEIETLKAECVSRLESSDNASLQPYYRLQQLKQALGQLQQSADGAAPHLVDFVTQEVYTLRYHIQDRFSRDLEKTLKALQWPKIQRIPLALESDWNRNVGRLFDLQRPELDLNPQSLIALDIMVQPLEQRFIYHFSGDKPTNRLDKPEYFLNHVCDLVDGYTDFLTDTLQPLLITHFYQSKVASIPAYIDATSAFITALMPMLQRKLTNFASQVEDKPELLSHLVHETIAFDTTMHESFVYTPASPSIRWQGLSFYLLDTCGYYQRWLVAERDFALTRYQSIIDAPDAGELDHNAVSADATKPSKSAIRVNDLLETITDQYRQLSSFNQKLRFLMDIQIAIFDKYHLRLHSSLEAYMTMTSSVARTVHGISKDDQRELQGVKGLDRLCRIFGSAEYMERAMRDWSDDVFFLELWEELQRRAGGNDINGALFDETADAYQRLRVRSENILVETLTWNVREALRAYTKVNTWASLATSTGTSVTSEIEPVLRLLTEYLNFLSKALGRVPLRRIVRLLCHGIQTTIWDQVLLRHSFSTTGAEQIKLDVDAICADIGQYIGLEQARSSLRRLVDGTALLSLPVRDAPDDDAAWEVEDEEIGLLQAEQLIFKDNESARIALERLGLDSLSEQDARQLLGKRVETSM